MRITARGWSRDVGQTEIMNKPLSGAEVPRDSLSQDTLYKRVTDLDNKRHTKVHLSTSADLRLGGKYLLRVELTRKEIAELFFDTHRGAMVRMIQSFIDEEEREERAHYLAKIEQLIENRRQRRAEQDQSEPQAS
jgi:hypothetical protein